LPGTGYGSRVPATDVDLAALHAHLSRRGARLDEAAVRAVGQALAAALAEAHATLDGEGNLAPAIHGGLGPAQVRVGPRGEVSLDWSSRSEATAPELREGGRLTPRADVHALGTLLAPLLAGSLDGELLAALATATEPLPARRRITCVELEAWLSRGVDLDAGRRALGEAARACPAGEDRSAPEAPPSSRPLAAPARIGVALITAAVVFAAGVLVAERWLGR